MKSQLKVQPGSTVQLADIDPDSRGKFRHKSEAAEDLQADRDNLVELQAKLYAEGKRALLVVLQAMDTGGKDGTIRHVMAGVNPQGVYVHSFKAPTPEDLAHDYLWRVHCAVPAKGMIGIFNRSHYEDVLIVRVHELVPKEVWKQRYEQINQFEKYLTATGTTILKFFLYISKDEQKRRLQSRLDHPNKTWKFAVGDLQERRLWGQYMDAYQDMLNRTSTEWAPWYVIPANHKWYRNLCVAHTIVETLQALDPHFPEPEQGLDKVVIPD